MEKVYNVLLVDDDSSDIELMKIQFKKINLDMKTHSVHNRQEFEDYFTNQPLPDLVISDYQLPEYNGEKALKFVRDRHDYVPFILVTGYLDEEEAVKLMKKGASDIITKQKLDRLVPAVQRELINFNERVEAQREIEIAHNRFRSLVEQGGDVVVVFDDEGVPEYISPSVETVFGYPVKEAMSINLDEVTHPDEFHHVQKALKRAMKSRGENIPVPPVRMKHKDGTWRWVETSLTDLRHQPSVSGIVHNIRDIHEQVLNARNNKLMLNNTEDSFIYINRDLVIQSFNDRFASNYRDIFEIDVERGESILEYAQQERRQIVKDIYDRVLQGETIEGELPLETKEGKTRHFQIKYKPAIDQNESIIGSFISLIEITDEKKAKLELEKNEARYRALVENGKDVIVLFDKDFKPFYMSQTIENVLGYSVKESQNLELMSIVHPDDIEGVSKVIEKSLQKPGETLQGYKSRVRHKDGTWRWVEATVTNFLDDPNIGGIIDNFRDITERVEAEEERNETLLALAKRVKEQRCLYEISKLEEQELTIEELLKKAVTLISQGWKYPEIIKAKITWNNREFKTDGYQNTDWVLQKKFKRLESGNLKIDVVYLKERPELTTGPFLKEEEDLLQAIGEHLSLKIEQIIQRQELNDQRQRLQDIMNQSVDMICTAREGKFLTVNAASKEILGYKPEEMIGRSFTDFLVSDDTDETYSMAKQIQQGSEINDFENRYRHKDGQIVFLRWSARWNKDEQLIYAIARDATETKRADAQDKLKQKISEFFKNDEKLKTTLESMLDYLAEYGNFSLAEIWLVNSNRSHLNLISTYARDLAARKFYKHSKNINRFEKGEGLPGEVWKTSDIHVWDELQDSDNFIRRKAADKANIHSACALPLFHNDVLVGVLVLGSSEKAENIENKINPYEILQNFLGAEIKRKQQEEEMIELFESAPDIMAIASPEGRFTKVNPAFCELLDYSEEELTSQPFEHFIHPDDQEATKLEYSETISGERKADDFINRYKTKSGEYKWISWSSSDVFGEDGNVFAFGRDVTERMELQELLNQAQKMAKIGGWEFDLVNETVYWSPITKEIHEVPPDFEPNLDAGISFYKEGESRDTIRKAAQEAFENGTPIDVELQIETAKGNERWIRAKAEPEMVDGRCVRLYGSLQDIHDRKEAQVKMIEALEERRRILERITEAFFAVDKDWTVTYWNSQAEEIMGVPKDQILGLNLWDEFTEARELKFYSEYHRAFEEQVSVHFEEYFPPLERWFEVYGYPSKEGLSVFFHDITDKKASVEELKQAHEKLKNAQEIANLGYFEFNLQTEEVYWSEQSYKIWEFDPEENLTIEKILNHMPREDREHFLEEHEKGLETGKPLNLVHRILVPDGSVKWVRVLGKLKKSSDGTPVSVEGTSQDITKIKRSEEKIRRINERFEKVTEATNDAIWDFDVAEEDLFWGKGFETLFGYDLQKIDPSFEFVFSLIHPDDQMRVSKKIETYMAPGGDSDWFEEYRFRRADDTYAYVMDRAVFIRNDAGEVTRVVGAMTDLTRQKEFEESLKALNQELEQRAKELAVSNAELEQFAYVASHDLQEPLRMVTSFLTQLNKKYGDQLDDKAGEYIHYAVDGAQRMRQIILDLLNYSRLNRDHQKKSETDLNEIFNEVKTLSRSRIEEANAEIVIRQLPTINVNPTGIKQVLQNLLSNALKYQRPDVVPIIAVQAEELESHWRFSIKDNGIGINPEFQDTIFQIFQRLHTRDQYSGTGIGLAIAKKIIERHGGEIWVDSEEGQGSTFYFTIEK